VIPAARATIHYDRPMAFAADGDRICEGTTFDLRASRGALAVIC
jgi:hypothetical protein